MLKKSVICFILIVFFAGYAFTQEPFKFYGNFIGIEDYSKMLNSYEPFMTHCSEKDYEKAIKIAEETIEANPDLDWGYKLKFRIGMLKQDIQLVKESLSALTGKYFFYIYDYNEFSSSLNGIEDEQFKEKIKPVIENFLVKRENFLKEKLNYSINTKILYRELALLNYETGDEEEFLTYLEKVLPYDYGFSMRFSNKQEWKSSNRLAKLKGGFRDNLNRWDGTLEQKMKILLLVATEMKSKNASLDFSPIEDWNTHVAAYLPYIIQAKDKQEFYELLVEMIAKVGENHTALSFPSDIRRAYSHCGLETVYGSGEFLVKAILKKELEENIKPGDEIISINQMSVEDYIRNNKSRYPFVSYYYLKPETHAMYRIGEDLLRGKKDSEIQVGFKRLDDSVYILALKRDFYKEQGKEQQQTKEQKKLVELKILKDNIYYFRIKRFFGSNIYNDFLELIKKVNTKEVKGVIFDIRGNTGGNSGFGDRIFSHFTDIPANNYIFGYYPARSALQEFRGFGYLSTFKGGSTIQPASLKKFGCPVVILISPRTGSASEDFSFLFKYHKRGAFVGLPTGGGTGNGYNLYLPGGGTLRICLNIDLFFSWKGIQPDYLVDITAQDIIEKRDTQLEKALEILRDEQ
jgi:C-terminal processing protease CtpA/Prc